MIFYRLSLFQGLFLAPQLIIENRRCGASAEGKLVCTVLSREEEKTPKGD